EAENFGIAKKPRAVPTVEEKALAKQKAKATRIARGTKGPKEKLKIKGVLPSDSTPAATAPAATAPAPTAAIAPAPAASTTVTPTAPAVAVTTATPAAPATPNGTSRS